MIAFGPVPSRRLGRSLGINNIPPKICTYACVYCQLERTIKMQAECQPFYEPEEILQDVRGKVEKAGEARGPIDYLTFVPDGEPTAVHHMREDAVDEFLARAGTDWEAVRQLVAQDRLVEAEYEGHRFYLRRLGGRKGLRSR